MSAFASVRPSAAVVQAPVAAQAPAANVAAVLALAQPGDGSSWHLSAIRWSYTGTPTGGKVTIAWGGNTETYWINAGGPGLLSFPTPRRFDGNVAVTITLATGGTGISGTVYADAWTE